MDTTLTMDGVAALAAGLLVLVGLWVGLRAVMRRTERVAALERDAAVRERGRQKLLLARALLFELDGFYRHYLRDVGAALETSEGWEGQYPVVNWVAEQPFPVYVANAGRLGELDEDTLSEVIRCYAMAAAYLSLLRDYKAAMDRVLRKEALEVSVPEARLHLNRIREALPELVQLSAELGRRLCSITGVPFHRLTIGAAKTVRATWDAEPEHDVSRARKV